MAAKLKYFWGFVRFWFSNIRSPFTSMQRIQRITYSFKEIRLYQYRLTGSNVATSMVFTEVAYTKLYK